MKRIVTLVVLVIGALLLTGCWPGEVGVHTTFNADGSGRRTFVIDVMDDLLHDEPIGNPDDPDGVKDKGPVLNDKHITGGVIAIQTWLEENAPSFITVAEASVEGYHRYFTFYFDFSSFNDFMNKYEQLVNLSPSMSWSDFDESEKPTLTVSGLFSKRMTFTESKDLLWASLDWALDGIWNDIYDEADIAGYVEKDNIAVLAEYRVEIGNSTFEEVKYYDEDAPDEDDTGKVIFVESADFTANGSVIDFTLIILVSVGALVLVLGGAALAVFLVKKKK